MLPAYIHTYIPLAEERRWIENGWRGSEGPFEATYGDRGRKKERKRRIRLRLN